MFGLEDNTACYGQEKLWVNIAVCHPVSVYYSHTPQKLWLQEEYRQSYSYKAELFFIILPVYNIYNEKKIFRCPQHRAKAINIDIDAYQEENNSLKHNFHRNNY